MNIGTLTEEDILFIRSLCRRNFANNTDLANDCFLYVWEKLNEDNYRRIRAYRGEASFRTFLRSVTGKLVIDFRRNQFGYKVLPKYYWAFDDINRHVFKLFFFHNLTPDWIENSVRAEFKIPFEEAQRRVDEVEKRIRESRVRIEELDERRTILLGDQVDDIATEGGRIINPEENLMTAEAKQKKETVLRVLREEVHKLEEEDILILQLYFEQGLSGKEISGVIPGLGQKKVYKRIEKTLRKLGKYMREKGVTDGDIRDIFEQLL